jgi:hypothetical protein
VPQNLNEEKIMTKKKIWLGMLAIVLTFGMMVVGCGGEVEPDPWKPPTTDVTTLTADTWADGSIATSSGEQWFSFTATAETQYIHFDPGTLTIVYVRLYDSNGSTVKDMEDSYSNTLSAGTLSTSRTLTIGNEYYIEVWPYTTGRSGTYRIAFGESSTPPPSIDLATISATTLTADTWANGNIATSSGEQWFTFTATGTPQYIHFEPGGEYIGIGSVYVQLYDSDGSTVENRTSISRTSPPASRTVTSGDVYYIKVTPYSSNGAYEIAFSTSDAPPPVTLPTTGVTTLTANTFSSGNIATTNSEQWFTFTATAETQYIHFEGGTMGNVSVQLYDNTGSKVEGGRTQINDGIPASQTLNIGSVYYIKATPVIVTGAYKIGFNTSSTTPPPSVTLPTTNVTTLTADTWASGNIATSGGEQWFTFTATAETQYIHFEDGTLSNVYVQLYDSNGSRVGTRSNLYANAYFSTSRTLTIGNVYYIKVTPYSSYGTYRIGFNATSGSPSVTLPTADVTTLTANTWANGSISVNGVQWFKFTATDATQYIHFAPGSMDNVNVQLYDSNGKGVEGGANLHSDNLSISRTLTVGSVYYIKVRYGGYGGTYRIAFNASSTQP